MCCQRNVVFGQASGSVMAINPDPSRRLFFNERATISEKPKARKRAILSQKPVGPQRAMLKEKPK